MTDLGHDEAYAELEAVALDTAASDVRDAVRAHASACPECGPELAAMEETVATLGHLIAPARMNRGRSAGIRSRLVMRARAERETWSPPMQGPPDLMRGVASLTGLGHKSTPSAQRAITGETKRVTPAHAAEALPAQIAVPSRALYWYAIAATVAIIAMAVQLAPVSAD